MNQIIHINCELSCDHRQAFKEFTDNQLLESWLCVKANVIAEQGGAYELFWQPEKPEINSTLGCCMTAVQPQQLLSFEWRSPVQFKDFANQADPLTHVTVSFFPKKDTTIVHLIHSGWRKTEEWEAARQWQLNAWKMAFSTLQKKYTPQT
ncbi:SRPBCC domain-containing protein [Marinicella sp. W31]|uniref:SRPBCC family protein n=1 Tax=Marinicella sp. W31 TaxID=3023713 RepID=UPI0037584497